MKLSAHLLACAGALALVWTPGAAEAKLRWFGVSESVAEFGSNIPGVLGKDYYWPNPDAVDLLIADGMNIFRIPFLMERIAQNGVNGTLDPTYLSSLVSIATHITSKGAWALIDPHNYGRYNGTILEPDQFKTFWANLATHFAQDDHIMFDTNNEYHDMTEDLVVQLNQVAIDAIRSVGAKSQYIFVEGNAWSGAWTWVDNNDAMKNLTDPENKIVYEMHNYFNTDGSSSSTCVNSTIGRDRVVAATEWLRSNKKVGAIGEFSGYNNTVCKEAVAGMVQYLSENSDVWTAAMWWAAGPWWGTSEYSFEPPTGEAYLVYKSILQPYYPSAPATSTTSTPTTSTTSTPTTSTTSTPTTSTTSVPTTSTTSTPTTQTTGTTSTATSTTTTPSTTAVAQHWGQCGGIGYNGPTTCQSPYTCKKWNDWYSQCL